MTHPPSDSAAVELVQVTKSFGPKLVLDDVSLRIPTGQTTVLLGPSGTGKSTLIRLAVGLLGCEKGQVLTLGHDVASLSRQALLKLRRRFGLLFQEGALFGSLTAGENVGFPLHHHLGLHGAELADKVAQLMAVVGLDGLQDRLPDALSGGQRKRVALARAIAMEPEVVFFDEPTSGLDPQTSASIDALIKDMQARLGMTFIVITHDVESARVIGDRIGVLFDGTLAAWGPSAEVFGIQDPRVRAFLDREPGL